jgi:putative ABC transport system permease protein
MKPATLVLRNITRRRSRFAFTLLGITVGIASLVTLLSLGTGLEKEVRKQADVLGAHLVVTPKGWCAYEQISVLTGETLPEAIPDADVKKISAIKGIQALPYLTQRTAIRNQPVPVVGILSREMKEYKKWEIGKGEYRLDEKGLVVGHGIAKQFKLSVDDVVSIRRKDFRIRGILAEVGNRDDVAVYLDLPVAQALYGVGDKVSFVSVKVDDISQIDKYILEIQETANVAVVSDNQLLKSVLGIVGAVGNALQLIAAVAILAACFGIVNTMMTAIYERRRETGILQALGAKRKTIFSLFLAESVFYGLAGGLLGVVVGFLFSYAAAPYISQNEFTAFLGSEQTIRLFDPVITLEALAFSVAVAVLSGIYPAWKASRLSPVEAISYE